VGPFSTAAVPAYCTLTPKGVPSFISRGAAHQAARATSASDGRNYRWNLLTTSNSLILLGSFTCRKAGTWDRYFYFPSPPKEGMLRIFTLVKIQRLRPGLNPRTREPEAIMLTTRPPKPFVLDGSDRFFPYVCLSVCF
jgi:hypothetical protein